MIAVPDALEDLERVPHAEPLQPMPTMVQLTPLFCESFCTVAVTLCVCPVCTDALVGFTVTEIAGGADVAIVMVAAAVLEVSAAEVAVNVTLAGDGTLAGAV